MSSDRSVDFFRSRPLYLITDGGILRRDEKLIPTILEVLDAVPQRVSYVQLREQVTAAATACTDNELQEVIEELKPLCTARGVSLLINRNATLAAATGVAGIHIGKPLDSIPEQREVLGSEAVIGYSAHSSNEAIGAFSYGADYVVLSPIFAPLSKISKRPPIGLSALTELRRAVDKPMIALGGITPANAAACRSAGADRIAVISSVLAAASPGSAAQALLAAWDSALKDSALKGQSARLQRAKMMRQEAALVNALRLRERWR